MPTTSTKQTSARVHNFNAGPSALPEEVLKQAQDELLNYADSGMSIMEHSHRGAVYEKVHNEALSLVRELLAVPDTHEVIFVAGGGNVQFAQVPLNFLHPGQTAEYIVTGGWGEKALEEARSVGKVHTVANTKNEEGRFVRLPSRTEHHFLEDRKQSAYVHITSNNTLEGTQYDEFPSYLNRPLIADMSSDILCRPTDVSRFALIYAAAQKNLGPAGLSVVIADKTFLAEGRKDVPKILRYAAHAKEHSLLNTPPTFAVYLVGLVLQWTKRNGGASGMAAHNWRKAEMVYGAVDKHAEFYLAPVEREVRSRMNIVFRLPSEALEKQFVAEAEQAGMVGLKGHRSTGGIRVSLYNAVAEQSAKVLAEFMNEFARKNG